MANAVGAKGNVTAWLATQFAAPTPHRPSSHRPTPTATVTRPGWRLALPIVAARARGRRATRAGRRRTAHARDRPVARARRRRVAAHVRTGVPCAWDLAPRRVARRRPVVGSARRQPGPRTRRRATHGVPRGPSRERRRPPPPRARCTPRRGAPLRTVRRPPRRPRGQIGRAHV
jgi:hypothetical protein